MSIETIKLQGKDYVLFKELLELAHERGLETIQTTVVQLPREENNNLAVVAAEVKTEAGVFTGLGDASPTSVNRMILPHLVRMAETRAVGRALRFALNIGLVMKEELGGDEPEKKDYPKYEKKDGLLKQVIVLEAELFDSDEMLSVAREGKLGKDVDPEGATQPKLLEYRDSLVKQLAMEREEQAYGHVKAWTAARNKYLGSPDIGRADINKLMAYCKHMKEKMEATQPQEEKVA